MKSLFLFLTILLLFGCRTNQKTEPQGDPNFFKSINPMSGIYSQERETSDSETSVPQGWTDQNQKSKPSNEYSHKGTDSQNHIIPPPPMPRQTTTPQTTQTPIIPEKTTDNTILQTKEDPPAQNADTGTVGIGTFSNKSKDSQDRIIPPPPMPRQTTTPTIPMQNTIPTEPTSIQVVPSTPANLPVVPQESQETGIPIAE